MTYEFGGEDDKDGNEEKEITLSDFTLHVFVPVLTPAPTLPSPAMERKKPVASADEPVSGPQLDEERDRTRNKMDYADK